jgi:uncharacterized protein
LSSTKRLLVVLAGGSQLVRKPASLAFRYAATAAALDLSVEIHVVGESVALLRRSLVGPDKLVGTAQVDAVGDLTGIAQGGGAFSDRDFISQIREMKAMEVKLFACSAALADAGLSVADLIPEVDGVRGAAALLAAGMADDTRLLSF